MSVDKTLAASPIIPDFAIGMRHRDDKEGCGLGYWKSQPRPSVQQVAEKVRAYF